MLFVSAHAASAQDFTITGRIIDSNKEPIPYATVVLMHDGTQVTGGATSYLGEFSLKAKQNTYTLCAAFVGYNEVEQPLELRQDTNVGDIVLTESSTEIAAVEVKANLITREADRFILDIENSRLAVGRDASEILKFAPGVWVNDEGLSINGNRGTKVFIDNREVKMGGEELINYLRSFPADDIKRIDVLPQSGAEYDASSHGGIIKITTKRKVNMGLMGSVGARVLARHDAVYARPSVALNYNKGKISFSGRLSGAYSKDRIDGWEDNKYAHGTQIYGTSLEHVNFGSANARFDLIYDINKRHSLGVAYRHNFLTSNTTIDTQSEYTTDNNEFHSHGDYRTRSRNLQHTASMSYIYKLDDKGSILKILADYTNSTAPNSNDYHDVIELGSAPQDSIYRNKADNIYHLATATVALEKQLSPKVQIRAGAKYTFNKNTSIANHEWQIAPNQWQPNELHCYDTGFTENIGAAYVAATAKLGRWSLVGGLRGEYTILNVANNSAKQSYFNLFPNANISYSLTEDGSYSLVAQYSRTISRPSFWHLLPYEVKQSEFVVMRGNPHLKAMYNNSVSITSILKYKYSITLGVTFNNNAIEILKLCDATNPNLLVFQPTNLPSVTNYFANVNIPVDITKWWSANISLMGQYKGHKYSHTETVHRRFSGMANAMMSFTLPKNFFIDVDGYYISSTLLGNSIFQGRGDIGIKLKSQLLKRALTLSLGVDNILSIDPLTLTSEESYKGRSSRTTSLSGCLVSFSVLYKFDSGKKFKAKSVESGSQDDLRRIGTH